MTTDKKISVWKKIDKTHTRIDIIIMIYAFIIVDAICNSYCLFEFIKYFGFILGCSIPVLIYRLDRVKNKPPIIWFCLMALIAGSFATSIVFVFLVDINKAEKRVVEDPQLNKLYAEYNPLKDDQKKGWNKYFIFVEKGEKYPAQMLRENYLDPNKIRLKELKNQINIKESELKNAGSKFNESIPFKNYSKFFIAYMGMLTPIGIISSTYLAGIYIPGFLKNGKKNKCKRRLSISNNIRKAIDGRISVKLGQIKNNRMLSGINQRSNEITQDQPVSLSLTKNSEQIVGVRLITDTYIELINNKIEPKQYIVRRLIAKNYTVSIKKSTFRNYYLKAEKYLESQNIKTKIEKIKEISLNSDKLIK